MRSLTVLAVLVAATAFACALIACGQASSSNGTSSPDAGSGTSDGGGQDRGDGGVGSDTGSPPSDAGMTGEAGDGDGGDAAVSVCSTNPPTYYVAATGNDSNAGTSLAAAFATVDGAIAVARPGDIIQIEPGTYPGFVIWNGTGSTPGAAGTASQHFTIRGDAAYPRGSMIIDDTLGAGPTYFWGNYWDICHIRVTASTPSPTTGQGFAGGYGTGAWATTSYIHVDDVEIDHQWGSGFRAFAPSSNITISRSYVHDNCMENFGGTLQPGATLWDNGITLDDTTDSIVENNLVEDNWGEAIDIIGRAVIVPMNDIVRGNTIHNSYSIFLYDDHAPSNTWVGNFGYNDDPAFYRMGNPATGMAIADESAPNGGPGSAGVIVMNNITYGAYAGFRYGAYNLGLGMHDVSVVGNTFVASTGGGIWIDEAASTAGNVFSDNIVMSATGVAAYVPNAAGLTFSHNAWSGITTGIQAGPGDVTADPLLVGEAGWSSAFGTATSYAPRSSSPVIGAGEMVAGLTTDFFGAPRPNPPSVGAIEAAP
jgi:hypothetical protein